MAIRDDFRAAEKSRKGDTQARQLALAIQDVTKLADQFALSAAADEIELDARGVDVMAQNVEALAQALSNIALGLQDVEKV